jgi:hypothetical protein
MLVNYMRNYINTSSPRLIFESIIEFIELRLGLTNLMLNLKLV